MSTTYDHLGRPAAPSMHVSISGRIPPNSRPSLPARFVYARHRAAVVRGLTSVLSLHFGRIVTCRIQDIGFKVPSALVINMSPTDVRVVIATGGGRLYGAGRVDRGELSGEDDVGDVSV